MTAVVDKTRKALPVIILRECSCSVQLFSWRKGGGIWGPILRGKTTWTCWLGMPSKIFLISSIVHLVNETTEATYNRLRNLKFEKEIPVVMTSSLGTNHITE